MKNQRFILIFVFILLILQASYTQTTSIDSLQYQLSQTQYDTSKIKLLTEISLLVYNTNPLEALGLAQEAQLIAEKEKYFVHQTRTNNAIAASNWLMGNYDEAIEYVHKNIAINEKGNNQENLAENYHHLSLILAETSQVDKALEYTQRAIDISIENNFKPLLARAESQAAKIYIDFKDDYALAEISLNKALQLYTELNDTLKIGYTENNLGRIYFHNKQYDQALQSFERSLAVCIKYRANNYIRYVLNNIGDIHTERKEYIKARGFYLQSLDASKFYQLRKVETDAYLHLAKLDSLQQNYFAAIGHFQKYYNLQSLISSKEKEDKIAELQIKYESDSQKRENELLRKSEKIMTIILRAMSIAILLILIILAFLWRLLRIKQKSNDLLNNKNKEILSQKNEIGEQKKALQNQAEELAKHQENLEDLVTQRTLELLESKDHAEESDRLKTAFLNNISHEYRTPMNGIMGFSSLLTAYDASDEERQEYSQLLDQSCNQLLNLVVDTVEISKIHSQQEKIVKSMVNIQDVISNVLYEYSDTITKKGLRLKLAINCTPEQLIIQTDENKFQRILGHLIDNAVKFTHKGSINIICEKLGNKQMQFQIEDTGIGIPVGLTDKIFEPFRQVEANSPRNIGGSGIGLSISKAYIELLDGKIHLESELGKGTNVYFSIPLDDKKNIMPEEPKEEPINIADKTILIAEDNQMNFLLIKKVLSLYNCKLLHAWNGKTAVDLVLENKKIDLILMDLKMPILDGYMATQLIKDTNPKIPIIALTAYTLDTTMKDMDLVNFDAFISKPIDTQNLMQIIMQNI